MNNRHFVTVESFMPIRREGPLQLQPVRRECDALPMARLVCTAVVEATRPVKFTWRGVFCLLRPAV